MRSMAIRDPERRKKLLSESRRQKRAAGLVAEWASNDVCASPVAQNKYALLVDRLRAGHAWPLRWTNDLPGEVRAFVTAEELIVILGWDVEEEPALLVSSVRLTAKVAALDRIYPDAFVLISDVAGQALLVDFDADGGTHVNIVGLQASPR